MPLVLKNAHFFDYRNNSSQHTNILIEEGLKGKLKFSNDINKLIEDLQDVRIIDCYGKIVMRSFVNAHQHSYLSLTRTHKLSSEDDFAMRLKTGAWKIDKILDAEILEAATLYSAIDALKNGTTCVIEHHSSQTFIEGSLEVLQKSFHRAGLQFLPCFEISDRHSYLAADAALAYTDSWLRSNQGLVGLHASFTVGNSTLKNAVELASKHKTGIHIHAAESTTDQDHSLKEYGKTVIERLFEAGVLDDQKTVLAHAIHLSDEEARLINESGVYVVQNMESNLRSNVGFFNSEGIGENIMLGTDGLHNNMLRSAKMSYLAGQGFDQITPEIAIKRLRTGNEYFAKNKFCSDCENNLLIFDYPYTEEINLDNLSMHMIFGMESKHLSHVISQGEIVVEGGKLTKINEEDSMYFIREMTRKLIKLFGK
ncbi:MAG: amidohydrolase family protein [Bacteroidales bacterium]|nr:amidohydrolase family protein [Bacteroidales bacterium]